MAELPELLDYVEEHTDLSVIAITEHDDLRPALEARERWARRRYRYELIVGAEITTLEGHLLALDIEEPVESLRPLVPTLEAVHRQGGLCIIPHPLCWLTRSLTRRTIERVLAEGGDGAWFDGIELARGKPRLGQNTARRLNRARFHLAAVGGSDAHFLQAVGCAYTTFAGSTAAELRAAIAAKATGVGNGRFPTWRELGPAQVVRQQYRGFLATPRKMGWGPTIRSFLQRVRP